MAAIHSIREHGLFEDGVAASNYSSQASLFAETSMPSDFSLLHSKVVWAFTLLLAFVVAKILGSKSELPPGTRPLPALKGRV